MLTQSWHRFSSFFFGKRRGGRDDYSFDCLPFLQSRLLHLFIVAHYEFMSPEFRRESTGHIHRQRIDAIILLFSYQAAARCSSVPDMDHTDRCCYMRRNTAENFK